ncbi:MAG: hypothetical protein ACE5HN_00830, partial [Nitrospiria bacterium]
MDRESNVGQLVDPDSLMDLLIDLQIGIRKLSIYPLSHPIIPNIVSGLAIQFNTIFEFMDTVPLGITRDEILYQGAPIAKDNPVIHELANLLHQLNLIGVTFCKGLTEDEILRFIKMIAEDRSPLLSEREQVISRFQEEVRSILLQFINFEGAVQGQEDGLFSAQGEGSRSENARRDIWRDLVDQLTGDGLRGEVGGTGDPESDAAFDPVQAAHVINHLYKEKKGGDVKKEYEGVIVDYLHQHA